MPPAIERRVASRGAYPPERGLTSFGGVVPADAGARAQARGALMLVGVLCLATAGVLCGVALMLWAALPEGSVARPWLLVITPAVPTAIGLWVIGSIRVTTSLLARARRPR